MADIHLLLGRPAEARALIDRIDPGLIQMAPIPYSEGWYDAMIEHALGNRDAADAALERFAASEGNSQPLRVACVYAWRGENDAAFEWLNRALEQYPEMSVQYSWEPWFNSLEDDPRWAELMTRWTGKGFVGLI
jgi:tetratricopeptide (TPR) repeat protein